MTLYALLPLIAALIDVALLLLVFINNRRKDVVRPFVAWSCALIAWNLGLMLMYLAKDERSAIIFNHFLVVATMSVFPTNFHFVVNFSDQRTRFNRFLIYTAYAISIAFVACHFSLNCLSTAVKKYYWGYYPVFDTADMLYGPVFWFYLSYAQLLLFRQIRGSTGLRRNQFKFIFWATLAGLMGVVTNFLPVFNIESYPSGNLTSIIYYIATVYALVTVKMVSFDYLLQRLAVWTGVAAIAGGVSAVMALLMLSLIEFQKPEHLFSLTMLAALGSIAATGLLIHTLFLRLFKGGRGEAQPGGLFAAGSSRILSPSLLTAFIIYQVTRTIDTEGFAVILSGDGSDIQAWRIERGGEPQASSATNGELRREFELFREYSQGIDRIFLRDELEKSIDIGRPLFPSAAGLARMMADGRDAAAIPLYSSGTLRGCILLGIKRSGDMYDSGDLRELGELKVVAEAALENIEYVEEVVRQRNRIEQEMQRASKLKAIGLLTSAIAHEVRNPLAAIKMASYNIHRKTNDQSLSRHLANIDKKVEECDLIIQNLLTYSKVHEVHFEPVFIRSVVREACAAIQGKYARYPVMIQESGSLPEDCLINANAVQLKMLFTNLLDNAYQALPGHAGEISVTVDGEGDGMIRVAVRDTGVGIALEDLPAVFEPFFTKKAKGVGLGLTVCRMITEIHRGDIRVESAAGRGTTVIVRLSAEISGETAALPRLAEDSAGDITAPEATRQIEKGLLRDEFF